MSRRVKILLIALVLAAVAIGVWSALQAPPAAAVPERSRRFSLAGQNLNVFLVPVDVPPGKRRPALDLWQTLFPKISKDSGSREFLQQLFGGLAAEIESTAIMTDEIGTDENATNRQPGDGFAVVLRIDAKQPGDVEWERIVSRIGGRSDAPIDCLLGNLDFSLNAKFPAPTTTNVATAPAQLLDSESTGLDVVLMVANDYLLREQAGWLLVDTLQDQAPGRAAISLDEARQTLNQRAEAWRTRYAH